LMFFQEIAQRKLWAIESNLNFFFNSYFKSCKLTFACINKSVRFDG